MTKGIVSPWAKKPVANEAPSDAPRASSDPQLRAFDQVETAYVVMDGRRHKLMLGYLPCKDRDRFEDAAESFGECLKRIFSSNPEAVRLFQEAAISTQPPLGPKIVLKFGEVTLYAKASSQDLESAYAMAVDRLCTALSVVRGRDFKAKRTLDDFKIIISVKT